MLAYHELQTLLGQCCQDTVVLLLRTSTYMYNFRFKKICTHTKSQLHSIAFSEVKKYCNRTRCSKGACHTKMQAEKKFIFCVQ